MDFFRGGNKLMYQAQWVFVFASGLVQRNIANELTRLFLHTNKYYIP